MSRKSAIFAHVYFFLCLRSLAPSLSGFVQILRNGSNPVCLYNIKIVSTPAPAEFRVACKGSIIRMNFSIALLADKCHVSIAYMSYLIKKELNQSFSEYLWELRMKKAKELLSSTDMPIDEISVAVGYLNSSSFRRKFKQETGLTPSQYRAES